MLGKTYLGWSVDQGKQNRKVIDCQEEDISYEESQFQYAVDQASSISEITSKFNLRAGISASVNFFSLASVTMEDTIDIGSKTEEKKQRHYIAIYAYYSQRCQINRPNIPFIQDTDSSALGSGYIESGKLLKGYRVLIEVTAFGDKLDKHFDTHFSAGIESLYGSVSGFLDTQSRSGKQTETTRVNIYIEGFGGYHVPETIGLVTADNFSSKVDSLHRDFIMQHKVSGVFVFDKTDIQIYPCPAEVKTLRSVTTKLNKLLSTAINPDSSKAVLLKERLLKIDKNLQAVISTLHVNLLDTPKLSLVQLIVDITDSGIIFSDHFYRIKLLVRDKTLYLSRSSAASSIASQDTSLLVYSQHQSDEKATFKLEKTKSSQTSFLIKTDDGMYATLDEKDHYIQFTTNNTNLATPWVFDLNPKGHMELSVVSNLQKTPQILSTASAIAAISGKQTHVTLETRNIGTGSDRISFHAESDHVSLLLQEMYQQTWEFISDVLAKTEFGEEFKERRHQNAPLALLQKMSQSKEATIFVADKELVWMDQFLQDILPGILRGKGRTLTFLIGQSQAGKSIFTNYAIGNRFEIHPVKRSITKVVPKSPGMPIAKSGDGRHSETWYPSIYEGYCDCPGFTDSEGRDHLHAVSMFITKSLAKEVKAFIIMIDVSSLLANRGVNFAETMNTVSKVFESDALKNIGSNIVFVMNTKSVMYQLNSDAEVKSIILEDIQNYIKDWNDGDGGRFERELETAKKQAEETKKVKEANSPSIISGVVETLSNTVASLIDVSGMAEKIRNRVTSFGWGEDKIKQLTDGKKTIDLLRMINDKNSFAFHNITAPACRLAVEEYLASISSPIPKEAIRFGSAGGMGETNFLNKLEAMVKTRYTEPLLLLKSLRDHLRTEADHKDKLINSGAREHLNALIRDCEKKISSQEKLQEALSEVVLLQDLELYQGISKFWGGPWYASSKTKPFGEDAYSRVEYKYDDKTIKRIAPEHTGCESLSENNEYCYRQREETYQWQSWLSDIPDGYKVGEFYGRVRYRKNNHGKYEQAENMITALETELEIFKRLLKLDDTTLRAMFAEQLSGAESQLKHLKVSCLDAQQSLFFYEEYFRQFYIKLRPLVGVLSQIKQMNPSFPERRDITEYVQRYESVCWGALDPCYDHGKACVSTTQSSPQKSNQATPSGVAVAANPELVNALISVDLSRTAGLFLTYLTCVKQQKFCSPAMMLTTVSLLSDAVTSIFSLKNLNYPVKDTILEESAFPLNTTFIKGSALTVFESERIGTAKTMEAEYWDCMPLETQQLQCTNSDGTVKRVVNSLGYATTWEELSHGKYECKVTHQTDDMTVRHCVGNETEYVEYSQNAVVIQDPPIIDIVTNAGLSGALLVAIPEAIGDALYLSDTLSKESADYVKQVVSASIILATGSWMSVAVSKTTTFAFEQLGCSKANAITVGNTAGFLVNIGKKLTPVGLVETAANYAGGRFGFWAEKKIAEKLSAHNSVVPEKNVLYQR